MSFRFFDNSKPRPWSVNSVKAVIFVVLALSFAGNVRAEYFIFAGGHIGYTYSDTISNAELEDGQRGNNGLDVLAAWGTREYGIGLTYTTNNYVLKTEAEGIRLNNSLQGPGIIFASIYRNPQDAKTMLFIGVESLTMSTSTSKCSGNEARCDELETELSDSTAQTVVLGIIDTSLSGLGIGLTGRIYQSDVIDRAYDLNLLIGVGF